MLRDCPQRVERWTPDAGPLSARAELYIIRAHFPGGKRRGFIH